MQISGLIFVGLVFISLVAVAPVQQVVDLLWIHVEQGMAFSLVASMDFRVLTLIYPVSDVLFGTLDSDSMETLIGPQDGEGNRLASRRMRPALEISSVGFRSKSTEDSRGRTNGSMGLNTDCVSGPMEIELGWEEGSWSTAAASVQVWVP